MPEDLKAQIELLIKESLEWWEDHRSDTYDLGDGDYDNLYSGTPDFVITAQKLKKMLKGDQHGSI